MSRKFSWRSTNSTQSTKELEMPVFSRSYWFDPDFLHWILFVYTNGVFLFFFVRSLEGGDYQWIASALFEGSVCGLGLFVYQNFWPVLLWYRRAVRALAIVT